MLKLEYDNPEKVGPQIHELFLEDQELKSGMFHQWEQNIYFLNGQQNLEWNSMDNRFVPASIKSRRKSRPLIYITPEIEPIVRTLVSFLTRNKPKASCYPSNPSDDESVRRAKIADMVIRATWDMDNEYDRYVMAAYWLLTVGTVFRKDYWDSSARGLVHFGQTSIDQGLMLGEGMGMPPEMGQILGEDEEQEEPPVQHWGDMACAILNPFQMAVDFVVKEFEAADWLFEYSLQKIEWAKEQYSVKGPGYTGLVDKIVEEENFGRALDLDIQMRFDTAISKGQKPKLQNMGVFKEFYKAPCYSMPWNKGTDKPRGRQIVLMGQVVLYDGPSQYRWHPYTHCIYEPYLGRFWGKSLVEMLIPLQRRMNEINGAILENAQTMANPQVLVPDGTIDPGVMTGQHGLRVPWKPQPHGQKPERWQGIPLPPQYFNERQLLSDKMVQIAGSNAVMSGGQPTGVTAAAALQLLLENAQSQHGTLINSWEGFYERSQTKKIQNFQTHCREPRSDLIQFLKKVDKDLVSLDIDSITGDELEDSVTVDVEAGSSIPKSQAATQNQLMQFVPMGVLGDVVNDPITRQQFTSEFGIKEFDKTNNAEWEKIKWENSRMLKGEEPAPSPYDMHPLHSAYHKAETQKPSFIENAPQEAKDVYFAHIAWHEEQEKIAQQQQMMAAQGQQPGGPSPINQPPASGEPIDQGPEGLPPGMPPAMPQGPEAMAPPMQ